MAINTVVMSTNSYTTWRDSPEIELSPEYYTELLPHIPEPLGNIHFAGDYTHPMSFVDGAVSSAVTAARTLGGDLVTADEDRAMKLSARLFER